MSPALYQDPPLRSRSEACYVCHWRGDNESTGACNHNENEPIVRPLLSCLLPECPRDGAHAERCKDNKWGVILCECFHNLLGFTPICLKVDCVEKQSGEVR